MCAARLVVYSLSMDKGRFIGKSCINGQPKESTCEMLLEGTEKATFLIPSQKGRIVTQRVPSAINAWHGAGICVPMGNSRVPVVPFNDQFSQIPESYANETL